MLVRCACCEQEFEKKTSQITKSPNHYCSRSCAAKVNNRKFKKRKPAIKKTCQCGKAIGKKTTECSDCKFAKSHEKWSQYTIGDKIYDKHKYAKYGYVRYIAKKIADENNMTSCKNCGYNKHVEVCHIKAISTYPSNTSLMEVNDISNLITLCPNCHWEFDHGDLTLEQINGATEN